MSASARERTPFGNFQLRKSHLVTGANPYRPGTDDHDRFEAGRHFPDMTVRSRPSEDLDPDTLRRVRLVVAGRAIDGDDLAHLLGALGLDDSRAAP